MAEQPTLLDFISLFEVEPEWQHPDGWWCGVRFKIQRRATVLCIEIAPDELTCNIQYYEADRLVLRTKCVRINEWTISQNQGKEYLILTCAADSVKTIIIQINPFISFEWEMNW